MSTNKTSNYNLHSWVPQDEFHVSEINENFAALDAALHQEVGVLDALLQAETAARTQQMAGKADKTALEQKVELIVGTYQGNNSSIASGSQHIEVGVKPKAVIVMSRRGMSDYDGNIYGCIATQAYNVQGALTLDDSGFTVINSQNVSSRLNISGYSYCYWVLY